MEKKYDIIGLATPGQDLVVELEKMPQTVSSRMICVSVVIFVGIRLRIASRSGRMSCVTVRVSSFTEMFSPAIRWGFCQEELFRGREKLYD